MTAKRISIDALPDAVLLAVFQKLDVQERHRAVPLTCQRWNALLVNTPSLLHSIQLRVDTHSTAELVRRAHLVCAWLARRAAGHVRLLDLSLTGGRKLAEELLLDPAADLAAALAACGVGGLQELKLSTHLIPTIGSWLAAMHSLRRVDIELGYQTAVSVSLEHLTALQCLKLSGMFVEVEPEFRLPQSLTALEFGEFELSESEVELAAGLPNLRSLSVANSELDSGFLPLTRLAALERLSLQYCYIPECLSALTSLRCLSIAVNGDSELAPVQQEEEQHLEAALPHLKRLQQLELIGFLRLPNSMSKLCKLSSLWVRCSGCAAALPGGPWLSRLRQLAGPSGWLQSSLSGLELAPQLQQLDVLDVTEESKPALLHLVRWAVQHPTLQQVAIGAQSLPGETCSAILQAQRQRASLSIKVVSEIAQWSASWSA